MTQQPEKLPKKSESPRNYTAEIVALAPTNLVQLNDAADRLAARIKAEGKDVAAQIQQLEEAADHFREVFNKIPVGQIDQNIARLKKAQTQTTATSPLEKVSDLYARLDKLTQVKGVSEEDRMAVELAIVGYRKELIQTMNLRPEIPLVHGLLDINASSNNPLQIDPVVRLLGSTVDRPQAVGFFTTASEYLTHLDEDAELDPATFDGWSRAYEALMSAHPQLSEVRAYLQESSFYVVTRDWNTLRSVLDSAVANVEAAQIPVNIKQEFQEYSSALGLLAWYVGDVVRSGVTYAGVSDDDRVNVATQYEIIKAKGKILRTLTSNPAIQQAEVRLVQFLDESLSQEALLILHDSSVNATLLTPPEASELSDVNGDIYNQLQALEFYAAKNGGKIAKNHVHAIRILRTQVADALKYTSRQNPHPAELRLKRALEKTYRRLDQLEEVAKVGLGMPDEDVESATKIEGYMKPDEAWAVVQELKEYAARQLKALKLEAATFSREKAVPTELTEKYERLSRYMALGKEHFSEGEWWAHQAIKSFVNFYNMLFDAQESTGGVNQNLIMENITKSQVQFGPLLGSVDAFRELLSHVLGQKKVYTDAILSRVPKKLMFQNGVPVLITDEQRLRYDRGLNSGEDPNTVDIITFMRERAIELMKLAVVRDKQDPTKFVQAYPINGMGERYDSLEHDVLHGRNILESEVAKSGNKGAYAKHVPSSRLTNLKDERGASIGRGVRIHGVKEVFGDIPDYALKLAFQLIKLDLMDISFIEARATGSSLSFGNTGTGGKVNIDEKSSVATNTDLLSWMAALGFDINTQPYNSNAATGAVVLYDESVVHGDSAPMRTKESMFSAEDYYHTVREYTQTQFNEEQYAAVFEKIHAEGIWWEFPPLSVAIQYRYVVDAAEYKTAASGWLYMREHVNEPLKGLYNQDGISEDVLKEKITSWFKQGMGKYKVIRGGVNHDLMMAMTKMYMARLFKAYRETTTRRGDTNTKSTAIEVASAIWDATTIGGVDTGDKTELKLDVIMPLFDFSAFTNRKKLAAYLKTYQQEFINGATVSSSDVDQIIRSLNTPGDVPIEYVHTIIRPILKSIFSRNRKEKRAGHLNQFKVQHYLYKVHREPQIAHYLSELWKEQNFAAMPWTKWRHTFDEKFLMRLGFKSATEHDPTPPWLIQEQKEDKKK